MNKKISEIVKRGKTIFKSKIKWILALILLTGCIFVVFITCVIYNPHVRHPGLPEPALPPHDPAVCPAFSSGKR